MYKIIRPNNSAFAKGQLVHDKEFNEEVRVLLAEGAVPAVAQFIPNYRWTIRNRTTGEIHESTVKFGQPTSALHSALNFLVRYQKLGYAGAEITVTADDRPFMKANVEYM